MSFEFVLGEDLLELSEGVVLELVERNIIKDGFCSILRKLFYFLNDVFLYYKIRKVFLVLYYFFFIYGFCF